MSQSTTIRVSVESAPHSENLDGVLLNQPAPKGGSFLINQRVERSVWDQMKAVGARYLSRDDLEDFDMFESEPGWRYGMEALRVLLNNGFTLRVRGEDVATIERLDAVFSAEGQAEYRQRREAEKAEKERLAEEERQRKQREADDKTAAYEAWKSEHLAGLVKTFANDSHDQTAGVEWKKVAFFDGPNAWYTTGDSWYEAEIDGHHKCYKCYYGNAIVCYAPQHIVARWCGAKWEHWVSDVYKGDEAVAARQLLVDSLQDYIGSDIAKQLVAIRGTEYFVRLATSSEWWIFGKDTLGWKTGAAEHYGAPYVQLEAINVDVYRHRHNLPSGQLIQSYWRHPDGQIIAKGYYDNETTVVTVEELPEAIRGKF